jgi:hypothetical protein
VLGNFGDPQAAIPIAGDSATAFSPQVFAGHFPPSRNFAIIAAGDV